MPSLELLDFSDVRQVYGLVALAGAAVFYLNFIRSDLAKIPSVGGPNLPLLSYLGTLRFFTSGRDILQEGYTRYKGNAFKIAALDRWIVILPGKTLVDELRRLPEETMSFSAGNNAMLDIEHTLGPEIAADSWHNDLVRVNLTKNMDAVFPEVRDEVASAFEDYIPLCDDGWTAIAAADVMRKVVCRASNRVFVGLPLCRDLDWIDLNVEFAMDVLKGVLIAQLFPAFLRPLAGRLLSTVPAKVKRGLKHLAPIIHERRQKIQAAANGEEYPEKPNDMLMWLLEHRQGNAASVEEVATRILALNFAAIHSSSTVLLHVLYTLAAHPEHVPALREEADAVINTHGWTKSAMGEMVKLDSYLKETTRFQSISGLAMMRMAMKPHTFTDGTTVPAGTIVATASSSTHHDDGNYPNADEFVPLRFVKDTGVGAPSAGQPLTTTSPEFLLFGYGKHACPGRFFASNEVKLILCHIILHYDVKTEVDGVRPSDFVVATERMPSSTAKLLFRKRQS